MVAALRLVLDGRNTEVERSVEELIQLVREYPRENVDVPLDEHDCSMFRRHYSRVMYQVRRCSAGRWLRPLPLRSADGITTNILACLSYLLLCFPPLQT